MKTLNEQYNNLVDSGRTMAFEINSNTSDEIYLYNIKIDNKGLYTIAYNEEDYKRDNDLLTIIRVDFDEYFEDLDYYLEGLHSECLEDIYSYENSLDK